MRGDRVMPRRMRELASIVSGPLAFLLSSGFIVWLMRSV